jgi:hypothetical protein
MDWIVADKATHMSSSLSSSNYKTLNENGKGRNLSRLTNDLLILMIHLSCFCLIMLCYFRATPLIRAGALQMMRTRLRQAKLKLTW